MASGRNKVLALYGEEQNRRQGNADADIPSLGLY